jgi:glycosyltransferase involved in cell wall biosynthesis
MIPSDTLPTCMTTTVQRGELLFLAPGDAAKGRVEPISWMRTCEAFAEAGLAVTLRTLRVRRPDGVKALELWDHYGIAETFRLVAAPTGLGRDAPTWQFRVRAGASSSASAATMAVRRLRDASRPSVVYARAPVLLAPFVVTSRALPVSRRPLLVFETHTRPTEQNGWIVRAADLVVVNSAKLAAEVVDGFGIEEQRVLYAPLPPYNSVRPFPKESARQQLSLPADAVIVCYTGKVTPEHSDYLLTAARDVALQIDHFRLLLVGGNPESLEWTRRRAAELGVADCLILAGFVAPAAVATYQSAADILVNYIPKTAGTLPYATPSKAYEYQAAERPIVVTDFPLFGEVFGEDGERAIRVVDFTPSGLADGIVRALRLPDGGRAMVERAADFVRARTWSTRAEAVLDSLGI